MAIGASETSADRYRREVAERFDGPLPPLFKERLFVHLSRFCRVRSCLIQHVGVLLGQNRPAGDGHAAPQTVEDVVALLRRPIPEGAALAAALDRLEATPTPAPLPEPQTSVEGDLFDALTVVFLWPAASERARASVRRAIGDATFELLIAYLAFIRTAHYWAETHPEVAHDPDVAATLRGHVELAALLLDTRDADLVHEEQWLRRALDDLEKEAERHRERLHDDLVASQQRLAAELAAAQQLQAVSTKLISEQEPDALYAYVLDAAMALMKADAASVQMLDPDGPRLRLLASRHFHPESEAFWQWVDAGSRTSCGKALAHNQRAVIEDIEQSAEMADTQDLVEYRRCGLRAVQSTPLISRSGRRLGMLSTQWRAQHRPEPDSFHHFDVLARQAADLIERQHAEASLRASEERQAFLLKLSDALRPLSDTRKVLDTAMHLLGEHLKTDRAFYYFVERDAAGWVHVVTTDYHQQPGMVSLVGRYPEATLGPALFAQLAAGQTLIVPDIERVAGLTPEEVAGYKSIHVGAHVAVPLMKDGVYVAGVCVSNAKPRQWTRYEIDRVVSVAERTWAAVERGLAGAALQKSEERLRWLNERLEQLVRERTAEIGALFTRLVHAQEEERRRIARDIHDQVGQQMTALRMNLEAVRSRAAGQPDLVEQAERTQRLAEELDRSIDFLTWQLRPAALDHLGLSAALQNLATGWSERFAVPVEFGVAGVEDVRLARDVEANLYRIAQEALHNVAKHADATQVTVCLLQRDGALVLLIEDNGRGFDPDGNGHGDGASGMGLLSMRERAALVGGRLEIESVAARGTSIYVRIPRAGHV